MLLDEFCDEDEEEMAMMREQMKDNSQRRGFSEEDEDELMEIDEGTAHQMPKAQEETKGAKPRMSRVLERCKEVGRVGPNITKMDSSTVSGNIKIIESKEGN